MLLLLNEALIDESNAREDAGISTERDSTSKTRLSPNIVNLCEKKSLERVINKNNPFDWAEVAVQDLISYQLFLNYNMSIDHTHKPILGSCTLSSVMESIITRTSGVMTR